jgi:hypothetical protein
MSKTKEVALVCSAAFLHFALVLRLMYERLVCDGNEHCISLFNKAALPILAFPLGLMSEALDRSGFHFNLMRLLGPWAVVLIFVNSILACVLAWSIVVKLFVQRRRRQGLD